MALTLNITSTNKLCEGVDAGNTSIGTVTTTGARRVGLLSVGFTATVDVSGSIAFSWAGNAMTKLGHKWGAASGFFSAIFAIIDPPTAASSISWVITGSGYIVGGFVAYSAQDCDRTTIHRGIATVSGTVL